MKKNTYKIKYSKRNLMEKLKKMISIAEEYSEDLTFEENFRKECRRFNSELPEPTIYITIVSRKLKEIDKGLFEFFYKEEDIFYGFVANWLASRELFLRETVKKGDFLYRKMNGFIK